MVLHIDLAWLASVLLLAARVTGATVLIPIFGPVEVPGSVRVILSSDYTGPGSGLGSGDPSATDSQTADPAAVESTDAPPPPSPIITAGSNYPECVN